ncbi:MAG: tRNA (N6-threonylcarbamoyladenosine(37)-N6)-methyltransferase TrmO [Anaerolineaceae bacterium]|nr:tRNA (N6-threonylcarbamoyladenosine(37)-N6)-methyltransferase TrmO [Anaerolineaceae bacterium]
MALTIEPIGIVKSPVTDLEALDAAWNTVVSEIHIQDALVDGLRGLEDWSHAIVIFTMHEAPFEPDKHLAFRPQDREDLPEVGVFAQRSRYYPNSIGVTAVSIEKIEKGVVTVKGLDAIDGTPVLAIKPYAPLFDNAREEPAVPVWFFRLMQG